MKRFRLLVPAVLVGFLICPALSGAAEGDRNDQKPAAEAASLDAGRKTRVRLGGIYLGAGYARHSGPWRPGRYSPYYWSAFSPYYSPFWDLYMPLYHPFHPAYLAGFARGPNMGEVKLRAEPRNAAVYLDGAWAGFARDLKSMWLEPGAYNLEVRADGRSFARRIYVLSGKTLRIEAAFDQAQEDQQR